MQKAAYIFLHLEAYGVTQRTCFYCKSVFNLSLFSDKSLVLGVSLSGLEIRVTFEIECVNCCSHIIFNVVLTTNYFNFSIVAADLMVGCLA